MDNELMVKDLVSMQADLQQVLKLVEEAQSAVIFEGDDTLDELQLLLVFGETATNRIRDRLGRIERRVNRVRQEAIHQRQVAGLMHGILNGGGNGSN